jgi:hypothetical protein
MKPALESASLRIVPLAIPNPSWAMVANMAATAAAIINDKMGMTTRLLAQLANPNLHDIPTSLSFHIEAWIDATGTFNG